jgi:hypothetical protein
MKEVWQDVIAVEVVSDLFRRVFASCGHDYLSAPPWPHVGKRVECRVCSGKEANPDTFEEFCRRADRLQNALDGTRARRRQLTIPGVLTFRTADHPEARGRAPRKGERSWTFRFPLDDGRELHVACGAAGRATLERLILDEMLDNAGEEG